MNAYVLVGGRSLRMGTSKQTLFLDRILAAARPVFDEVLAVHRADGDPLPVRTIFEETHDHEGPLFGISRALQDAPGKCFVVAVDYPLITADVLGWLAGEFESSDARMLVPVWDGKPQPLCAGYDCELLPLVERRIAEGKFDLHGLVAEAGARFVAEAELRARFSGEPLMNVNTPEELEAAEKVHGERFLASR